MDTQTLIRQLGTALPMMGAKDLVRGQDSLAFRIGRNVKGVGKILITLAPDDTYTVEAFSSRNSKVTGRAARIGLVDGVYCDGLHTVLESMTGLYTRL